MSADKQQPAFAPFHSLQDTLNTCVHCGLCLPTCPSYALTGQEMDSPRGRIYLLAAGVSGRIGLTPAVVEHFDSCLGCMACETACPSGVRYAPLIERARSTIETHHTRSIGARVFRHVLFFVLPNPMRLRLAAVVLIPLAWVRSLLSRSGMLSWLPRGLAEIVNLAPAMTMRRLIATTPSMTPAVSTSRMRTGLLTGCAQRALFGHVNQAAARVLAAEGCDVVAPARQECCGALALHSGDHRAAQESARRLIQVFEAEDVERVVVSTAGCGSAMKEYGDLLANDPQWARRAREFAARVVDITEVLTDLAPARAARHPVNVRAAYHDACHLAHAQGIRHQPRDLLAGIPALSLVPLAESELCCGSAGIFNLIQPEMAGELGRRKEARIAESGADVVITSNVGCMLQIEAAGRATGRSRPVYHLVEVLDASIRNVALTTND